jgi:hypothetical protein
LRQLAHLGAVHLTPTQPPPHPARARTSAASGRQLRAPPHQQGRAPTLANDTVSNTGAQQLGPTTRPRTRRTPSTPLPNTPRHTRRSTTPRASGSHSPHTTTHTHTPPPAPHQPPLPRLPVWLPAPTAASPPHGRPPHPLPFPRAGAPPRHRTSPKASPRALLDLHSPVPGWCCQHPHKHPAASRSSRRTLNFTNYFLCALQRVRTFVPYAREAACHPCRWSELSKVSAREQALRRTTPGCGLWDA